jgi:hypothetical protein
VRKLCTSYACTASLLSPHSAPFVSVTGKRQFASKGAHAGACNCKMGTDLLERNTNLLAVGLAVSSLLPFTLYIQRMLQEAVHGLCY